MRRTAILLALISVLGVFVRFASGAVHDVCDHGIVGDGTTDNTAKIRCLVNSASPGDTIYFPGSSSLVYLITDTIEINKSLTLEGDALGAPPFRSKIRKNTTGGPAIKVSASNVTIRNLFFQGGTTYSRVKVHGHTAIVASGASDSSYITDLDVVDCYFYYWRDSAVELEFVNSFNVSRNKIRYINYAGIAAYSSRGASKTTPSYIDGNIIEDIACLEDPVYPLGYGVAVSSRFGGPRSLYITVQDNTVKRVWHWEGLDTHGGAYVHFLHNTVRDCASGIMLVNVDQTNVKLWPASCDVMWNDVRYRTASSHAGNAKYGICYAGVPGSNLGMKATGRIAYNCIEGYGRTGNRRTGGIRCRDTNGLRIYRNDVVSSISAGISMEKENTNFHILHNDVRGVDDLSTLDRAFGIYFYLGDQTGEVKWNNIQGNPEPQTGIRIDRAEKNGGINIPIDGAEGENTIQSTGPAIDWKYN